MTHRCIEISYTHTHTAQSRVEEFVHLQGGVTLVLIFLNHLFIFAALIMGVACVTHKSFLACFLPVSMFMYVYNPDTGWLR